MILPIIVVLAIVVLILLMACYKKVSPNEVLVITGGWLTGPFVEESEQTHSKVKIVKGGGTFVIPIIQKATVQSLDTFNVDVNVSDIMTKDAVPVDASANAVLRIGSDPKLIAVASEKILGLNEQERQNQLEQVVLGGVREVLSGLTPLEANDRAKFKEAVINNITDTFENLGLEITALQITKISDKNGYFKALSAKDIADKEAEARKARAIADKGAKLVEAQNAKEAQTEQLKAEQEIAQARKETEVKKAEYEAEIKRNQEIANQASAIAKAEQDEIIAQKQIAVKENELKATVIAQENAQAQAMQIRADAQAQAQRVKANAEADQIKATGDAQAHAQRALADALSTNGEYALRKQIIDSLPEIAKSFSESLANIDNLTVFDGANGLGNQSLATLTQTMAFIKNATGVDLAKYVESRADGKLTITHKKDVD